MPKENILNNLYLVWGRGPSCSPFCRESVQFYLDLMFEGITSDEYLEYARNKSQEDNKYGI